MKRSILAAGVGLCIFASTMVLSNHSVKAQEYKGNSVLQDTTGRGKKKDTTRKKPDTMNVKPASSSVSH
jgi:hypothetical protein